MHCSNLQQIRDQEDEDEIEDDEDTGEDMEDDTDEYESASPDAESEVGTLQEFDCYKEAHWRSPYWWTKRIIIAYTLL